jgi:protein SCO1
MNKPTRSLEVIVWGGLALVIAGIFGAYAFSKLAPSPRPPLPVLATVPDFALTNQLGRTVTRADLRGCVWVADLIFTRCAGPCPIITREMSALQSELPPQAPVKLVSLTADPDYDTPEILKRYGDRFGTRADVWQFLTGNKLDIDHLAMKGLLLAVGESQNGSETPPQVIHSTHFSVIDKQGRMRATFDGTDPASRRKILEVIDALLRETGP